MNPDRLAPLEEISPPFKPQGPGAPARTSTAKRRGRRLSQTMTVRSMLGIAVAYLVAKFFEAPAGLTDAILVIGIVIVAISLRRALGLAGS